MNKSDYSVILVNGRGRLVYKLLMVELTGVYQSRAWKGKNIENSLIFTYDNQLQK